MIVTVDTGGTKTLVAVFDADGQIVSQQKFPTPPDINDYIALLVTTIDSEIERDDITCLSIGLPGTIVNGVMVWAGNLAWHGTDMKALLGAQFPCPIIVENDANLAGLAEARALREPVETCLYITVSTGIGIGLIRNGQIDANLSTAEGGHIVLAHEGAYARWETFASGKALHTKYNKLASEIDDPAIWDEIAQHIAQGLFVHLPLLQPQVVVMGGGVGAYFDEFSQQLNELIKANLKSQYIPVIIKAVHPEEAVIYGCYYHALDTLTT